MSGAKLTSVKDTTNFLVQQMSAEDRLSIVTFESEVRVDYPLQHMSPSSKDAAQKAISRITVGGGTNLSGGLFKGIDQHQQGAPAAGATAEQASDSEGSSSARSERIRSLFLFTDGQATTGVTNTPQLTSIMSAMLENPIRPTIHCFGFGQTYDSACLDSICQAGQGHSYFVEDAESIPGALSSALGGLMSMAAQNVELTFTPKEGVVIKSVDTAFPTCSQDGTFKVTVGDLYAEERKDILVKFAVGAVQEAVNSQEVMEVSVRCLDLSLGSMKESSTSAVMCRPAEAPRDVLMDPEVQEAVYRLGTAKVIKDAVQMADAGDLPRARRMLTEQLSQLPASSTSSIVMSLREDLRQILSTYRDRGSFMSSRNATLSRSTGHSSQRPTMFSSRGHPATGPGGSSPYMTSRQAAYASASLTAPSARQSAPASATAATGPNSLNRTSSSVSAAGTEVYAPVLGHDPSVPGHRQGQLGQTGTGSHASLSAHEPGALSTDRPDEYLNPWVDEGDDDYGDYLLDDEFSDPLANQGLAQDSKAGGTSPLPAAASFGFAGLASNAVGTPSLPAINEPTHTQAAALDGQQAAALASRDASDSTADADIQDLVQSLNAYHIPETVPESVTDDPLADSHMQAG
ncbi:TPA: hypothetical protein ACH3X1_013847 [Trebouxia sp. C0004]